MYLQKSKDAKDLKDKDKKKQDHESSDDSKEEQLSKTESAPIRKEHFIDFDYPGRLSF